MIYNGDSDTGDDFSYGGWDTFGFSNWFPTFAGIASNGGPYHPLILPPQQTKVIFKTSNFSNNWVFGSNFYVPNDTALENDFLHPFAGLWSASALVGNAFAGATGAVLAGVPAVATVLPPLANAVAYGSGYVRGAIVASTSGAVLLGKYYSAADNYMIDAQALDVGYFDLGRAYNLLDYFGDGWNANFGFLNAITRRGVPIYLGAPPVDQTGTYARELHYLFMLNYHSLVPAW